MDKSKTQLRINVKAIETYAKIRLLGVGTFGKVYLVESERTGDLFVVKEIDVTKMSEEELKETLKEAKILEGLNHPNIIKFREVYKTRNGALCIVMEYADGGDLCERIKTAQGNYFTEPQILNWFTQIALAIKHCHDRKILHRDLKSQNIFMTAKSYVKLGDFGISKILERTQDKAMTLVGTPYYLSPEIIKKQPYSFDADIWSLGVLLYEMCCLKPPFDSDSLSGLALSIISGKYEPLPIHYSDNIKELVRELLSVDPQARPSINQLLRRPFIHSQIKKLLDQTIYNREFAHTIIHGKVFGETLEKEFIKDNNINFRINSTLDYTAKPYGFNTNKSTKRVSSKKRTILYDQDSLSENKFVELPKLRSKIHYAQSPMPCQKKVSESPAVETTFQFLNMKNSEETKGHIEGVRSNIVTRRIHKKHSGHSVVEKATVNFALPQQKIKRSILKAMNDHDKQKVENVIHRNKVNISKLIPQLSFKSQSRERSQGRKRIYKISPLNISVINERKDPKEEELEKIVNELIDNIIKNSVANKKKMAQCDEDIDGMILEMKEVINYCNYSS